jgi:MFS family permease
MKNLFIPGTMKSVLGLGTTMTIGYGTLYYSFTIMSGEFQNEFGWSKSFIFGIFSLGILLGGILAPSVGKLLDKHGARSIMTLGSLLATFGLFLISQIENQWHYIGSILFLEVVSTLVLYEAAFVAFSQLAGNHARVPITQITLMAGFASTIFWPLISYMLTILSWRETYQILALFHLFISIPIHYFILKPNLIINLQDQPKKIFDNSLELQAGNRKEAFIYISIVFSLLAIPITVTQTHFMNLMQGFGYELVSAVALGALIGPAQVGARIAEMVSSKHFSPMVSGIFSILAMFIGFLVLLFNGYNYYVAVVFIVLYGAGQGLSDIIRGSIPLYLFGKVNYGQTNGKINFFRLIVVALVPFCFAYILDVWGAYVGAIVLACTTFIALVLLLLLQQKYYIRNN